MEIKPVQAFELNGKLFPTLRHAEKYQFEYLEPVQLGDTCEIMSSVWGHTGQFARVSCIEGDLIWLVDLNCPVEFALSGSLKHGGYNVPFEGRKYSWENFSQSRKRLRRITTCNFSLPKNV